MRATVANAGGELRLGRWAEPGRLDDEPSSVFHGLSTGAVPSNMKAAVGRLWRVNQGEKVAALGLMRGWRTCPGWSLPPCRGERRLLFHGLLLPGSRFGALVDRGATSVLAGVARSATDRVRV